MKSEVFLEVCELLQTPVSRQCFSPSGTAGRVNMEVNWGRKTKEKKVPMTVDHRCHRLH